ncbi:MAG: sensor histidine kinase, partial [Bacteroidia bacterium]
PISILQTRIENILQTRKLPQEASEKLVESLNTVSRLTRTIKALLLISKIENEQYLKNEQVSLVELAKEVISEIEERLTEKNILIEEKWKDDFVFGPANRSLLFTMIFNLISNAIKYNIKNGKIIIQGEKLSDKYYLKIIDTGIGMEPGQLNHIFDRFKRLEKNGSEGYGLGLPIVKKIVEFHKINVDVSSTAGTGSEFKLIFSINSSA